MVKNPPTNAGEGGLISDPGRHPGEGNGTPLQYFCLQNPMEAGMLQYMGLQRAGLDLATELQQNLYNAFEETFPRIEKLNTDRFLVTEWEFHR